MRSSIEKLTPCSVRDAPPDGGELDTRERNDSDGASKEIVGIRVPTTADTVTDVDPLRIESDPITFPDMHLRYEFATQDAVAHWLLPAMRADGDGSTR